jgi:transcriptional regulator with GAF, ATPase, and Fis domain
VRELDSCLMAAAILAGPEPIQLDHLAAEVRQGPTRPAAGAERPSGEGTFSDRISREAAADVRARIASNGGYDDDSTDPAVLPAGVPLSEEDRRIREEVVASLRTHGGNISAVARALGKDRKQIQRWVKRFDLDPQSFR